MKVLVVGSIAPVVGSSEEHVGGTGQVAGPEHDALVEASSELGYALAAAGHTLMVGSDSRNTADRHVVGGFERRAREAPDVALQLEINRPDDGKAPYAALPANVAVERRCHPVGTTRETKWFAAHVLALDRADALLTIGGGASTRIIGKIAAGRGRAVLAVPTFGGASAELYEHLSVLYLHQYDLRATIDTALAAWNPDSARRAVAILEDLAATAAETQHAYFISYSTKDVAAADHVEAVLRRASRAVNRDEASIDLGQGLNQAIQGLIESSDTYVTLVSRNFHASEWCSREMAFAAEQRDQGRKPRRIIELLLDEAVPAQLGDTLQAVANRRRDRELSIRLAIEQE